MNLFKKALRFPFCSCVGCGSYFVQESLLCQFCEKAVFQLIEPRTESFESWTIRSLFPWSPGESDLLSTLLVALKGPSRRGAWRFWAKVFSEFHFPDLPPGDVHSVSAPLASRKALRDHSYHWTEALSVEQSFSFRGAVFCKAQSGSQRKRSRSDRVQGLKLVKMTEENQDFSGLWVLGDDIVTTGETARAIYRGLGRPMQFEVWCLARRQPREVPIQASKI